MGTFFVVLAMVFGVLPFVTSVVLGRPLEGVIAGRR